MPKTDLINQATEKIGGYNAGFKEATSTYHDIIAVLFVSQVIQAITHRFISREHPFSISVTNPLTGKQLKSWGFEKKLTSRQIRVLEVITNNMFALGLALASYLFIVNQVDAYHYWLMK